MEIFNLLSNEDFYITCRQIRSIWRPIKTCINILEAGSANLADCYINLIKLAVTIYQIPEINPFKPATVQVFNRRYTEFQHPLYLLSYYLHPFYRGTYMNIYIFILNLILMFFYFNGLFFLFLLIIYYFFNLGLGLQNEAFRNAAITASSLWKDLGHSAQECKELISQFRYYDANKKPFDLPYVQGLDTPMLWWGSIKNNCLSKLAQRLFSISPSQANCERNFSTLKWFIGDKRTRLGVEKLEGMATIRSYHMANIRSELTYFDVELTESELREMVKIATIDDYITDEEKLSENNDNTYEESSDSLSQTNIILEDIVNLRDPIFQDREIIPFEFSANIADSSIEDGIEADIDMDFNPEDLVDTVLSVELEIK